jgi:hypothetical protein
MKWGRGLGRGGARGTGGEALARGAETLSNPLNPDGQTIGMTLTFGRTPQGNESVGVDFKSRAADYPTLGSEGTIENSPASLLPG